VRVGTAVARSLVIQLAAVGLGVAVSALVLTTIGQSFGGSIRTLFEGAFGSNFALTQTALKAVPLALCGLAVALPLRMRLWNIGAEGQFHLGAIAATWVALTASGLSGAVLLPLTIGAAMIAGAAWAFVAAAPRALWGVNEIITTLLLNYVAIQLLAYLLTGPLQGKESLNFPISDFLPAAALLPRLGTSLIHIGVFFPLALAILLVFLLWATKWGFEVRMIGASSEAARVTGISTGRNIVIVLCVGGAFAGLAGMIEVANTFGQLQQGISPGYGYMAIAIAALAGTSFLGTVLAGFLFGGFVVGGLALQTQGVPQAFVLMLEGTVLFCAVAGARLGLVYERRKHIRGRLSEEGTPSIP
jgi:simple sugar transport system permease protein